MGKKDKNLEIEEKVPESLAGDKEGAGITPTATTSTGSATFSASELEEIDSQDNQSGASRLAMIAKFVRKLGVGADLTNSSIPGAFILPKSTLSYFAENYSNQFELLLKANKLDDELERFLGVYKYLCTTCHEVEDVTRKPLNPVLGESYQARIENDESKNSYFFAEQISHHPPISCSTVYNKEAGVKVRYHQPVKSSFMGTYVKISMEGQAKIFLEKHQEEYTCSLPYMAIRIFRSFSEYVGKTQMTSNKSTYRIKTIFYPKPLLIGNYNCIESTVYRGKEKLYKIKGQWSGDLKITNLKTNETKPFFSNKQTKPTLVIPDELPSTDSSKVWKNVFVAASSAQGKEVTKEKVKVEEEQRKLAAERKEKKEEWKPVHFYQVGDSWVLNEYKD
ncbi:oxysterol binding family protein [Tieghemostelium lacteum]|uniref:Oxysterol binding family protein n=1 Tax=Tieghemostelium lacteum TaxID=361077 RepID=A0A151ZCL4_TIELA|nr:oxysterol binding family protein [Tieghemostelium lacteum]|eukprot:KYQ91688.1 oxysterol binding family protein [Tieghemostelium lacteum]